MKEAQGEEFIDLRQRMIHQLRSALAEVRFTEHSIHVLVELPGKPPEAAIAALPPWGGIAGDKETVDRVERYYLNEIVYTDGTGYVLGAAGVQMKLGPGFVSVFPRRAWADVSGPSHRDFQDYRPFSHNLHFGRLIGEQPSAARKFEYLSLFPFAFGAMTSNPCHQQAKTPVVKIAKIMKRTDGALRQQAFKLGISLGHQR
jgi:hypothetical protein